MLYFNTNVGATLTRRPPPEAEKATYHVKVKILTTCRPGSGLLVAGALY